MTWTERMLPNVLPPSNSRAAPEGKGAPIVELSVDFRRPLAIYTTAAFTTIRPADGERVAVAPVHAKAVGTQFTACGVNALTWVKFYGVAFWAFRVDRCADCVEVLEQGIPAHFVQSNRHSSHTPVSEWCS